MTSGVAFVLNSLRELLIYLFRVAWWRPNRPEDLDRFPTRSVEIGPHPFRFPRGLATAAATGLFRAVGVDDPEAFLRVTGTQAFIIVQGDRLLYEGYANGAHRATLVTTFSIAKSVVSLLIGIAVAEGRIRSVRDPITLYLPELARREARFSAITLRHLLMMASGIYFNDQPGIRGDFALSYYHPNLRRLVLHQIRVAEPPGARFVYNNYNAILLGLILERVMDRRVVEILQEKIWEPVGMEFGGSWSLDARGGSEKMESGFNARPIDLAKLGRLYLSGGSWDGRQIVPSSWVTESIEEDFTLERSKYYPRTGTFTAFSDSERGYYKYMWWGRRGAAREFEFYAAGNFAQFIYLCLKRRLISPDEHHVVRSQATRRSAVTWGLGSSQDHRSGREGLREQT